MIKRIVSGGQTGADRGALDAAIALGIPHGGWCPRGRLAEDGRISDLYHLVETESEDYAERTELNVRDSDGTVLFTFGEPSGGSAFTLECARRLGKPCLRLDLLEVPDTAAAAILRSWTDGFQIETLNVAGNRESVAPGLEERVRQIVVAAFDGSVEA